MRVVERRIYQHESAYRDKLIVGLDPVPGLQEGIQRSVAERRTPFWYAGHDIGSGVQISTGPVRRNPKVEDKFTTARPWMKEVQGECRRTRTESGYKAYLRASLPNKAKPQT